MEHRDAFLRILYGNVLTESNELIGVSEVVVYCQYKSSICEIKWRAVLIHELNRYIHDLRVSKRGSLYRRLRLRGPDKA